MASLRFDSVQLDYLLDGASYLDPRSMTKSITTANVAPLIQLLISYNLHNKRPVLLNHLNQLTVKTMKQNKHFF